MYQLNKGTFCAFKYLYPKAGDLASLKNGIKKPEHVNPSWKGNI